MALSTSMLPHYIVYTNTNKGCVDVIRARLMVTLQIYSKQFICKEVQGSIMFMNISHSSSVKK